MSENYEQTFIRWERAAKDSIDLKRVYIDVAEDLISGLVLSQIIFWNLPNRHGESKLVVEKDGYKWIAKTHADWLHECRISKKQAANAIEHLEKLEIIKTAKYKFGEKVQTHIRINWDVFKDRFNYILANVATKEEVESYWIDITSKDGRSKRFDKEANLQKGDSPNCNIGQRPSLQNVISRSDKKDDSMYCTENTTEITATESTSLVALLPQGLLDFDPLEKSPISKLNFAEKIKQLFILSENESTVKEIPQTFKVNYGDGTRGRKINNNFKERMFLLATYFTGIPVAYGGMEARAISNLQKSVDAGHYNEKEVYGCAVWAMEKKMFDDNGNYRGMTESILSINKLIGKFHRQLENGVLNFNAIMPIETHAEKASRIYGERNNEQIAENVAKRITENPRRKRDIIL